MPCHATGQVPFSFFLRENKIDYQAVIQYSRAFSYFLSETERAFYAFIIDCTARYGMQWSYIAHDEFTNGREATDRFAGAMPPPPVSKNTFYKILNTLQRLKLIEWDGGRFGLRFDTLPVEVAADEDVQKGFAARNRHNQNLRTASGIMEWAGRLTERLIQAFTVCREPKVEEAPDTSEPQENKADDGTTYSLYYTYTTLPLDKSKVRTFRSLFRDIFMGNRSASDILASVSSTVAERREKQTTKRKTRGTLADRTALFEAAWSKGQRDKDSKRPPARIVGKDRALIKSQILRNIEGTELDGEEFAYFVGKNWQAIGAQYFTKSKAYPEYPVIPWLIKCFETYVVAFQQREYLDETGTKSTTDYMRRAGQVDKMQAVTEQALQHSAKEIELLKAQLRERDKMLDEAEKGKLRRNDLLTEDEQAIVAKGRNIVFPDYDDPQPRKRKSRKIRKAK